MDAAERYRGRYPFLDFRRGVWREIARYVGRDAPGSETVIELGAGYCDFINAFSAKKKIAFDLNQEMRQFADPDVDFRLGDAIQLAGVNDASIDLVFASNFLEHLDQRELSTMLPNIRRVLRPGGRLILIQPNFRKCPEHYFDDETHKTVFSDESLSQLIVDQGFKIERIVPGFLPFSMKSRLPKWPLLVRWYLRSPIKPNAAQMYVVASRR